MQYKTIKALHLRPGNVMAWDSGYYDKVEAIESTKLGDILVRTNNDTTTMIFTNEERIRVIA